MKEFDFTVPQDWQSIPLEDMASCSGGFGFPFEKQGKKSGDFPFYKVSDMNLTGNEKFMRTANNWIDKLTLIELKAKTFPKSAIIFPKIGAAIFTNKKRLLTQESVVDNNVMVVIVNNQTKCLPEFLYFWFLTIDLGSIASPGTVPSLTSGHLQKVVVTLPPFEEQIRITGVLTTVQNSITQNERLISLTFELKSALMHKLFTKGLREDKQKQTEVGLIPESWNQLRLDKTGDVVYGIQAAVANNIQPIGMKILTNKNITLDGQIILDDINYFELKTKRHFETILKKGDILFNWRSGSKEHIGKTALFDLEGEYTHSSFILRIRPNNNVIGRFLFYYLFYLRESEYFLRMHDISSVNATFNKSAVEALPVFLPSKAEQEEIIFVLDTVCKKLALLKRKKQILGELFRTLSHQLMTAQTRVNG